MKPSQKHRRTTRALSSLLALLTVCFLLAAGTVGIAGATADTNVPFPKGAVETPVFLGGTEVLAGECARIGGTTYVPLRNFCSLFGKAAVTWNGSTNTATVRTDSLTLTARVGDVYIYANGHYFYTVGEILNLNGHLYVPIRPLARAFAVNLTWDAAASAVRLTKGSRSAVAWADYNADEVYWLSRIISAESRGEPMKGQIAVGNVVLNRVRDRSYPNTIYGVIFDRKYGTQFSPVSFGTIYLPPAQSSVIAAKICLEGDSLSDSVLFFLNPKIATSNWISRTRHFEFSIGNHDFYS